MTIREWTFELANTTTLTNVNIPNCNQVANGAGSTATASNAHPHSGATGALLSGAVSAQSLIRLNPAATNLTMAVRGWYWYSGTAPTPNGETFCSWNVAGNSVAKINISNLGKFQLQNRVGTTVIAPATVLAGAGLYRVEAWITVGTATTGIAHFAYYLGDSLTPVDTEGVTTTADFGTAAIDTIDIGRVSINAVAFQFYLDDWAASDGQASLIGLPVQPSGAAAAANSATTAATGTVAASPVGAAARVATATTAASGTSVATLPVVAVVDSTGWTAVNGTTILSNISDSDPTTGAKSAAAPAGQRLKLEVPAIARPVGNWTVAVQANYADGAVSGSVNAYLLDGVTPLATSDTQTLTGSSAVVVLTFLAASISGVTAGQWASTLELDVAVTAS